MQNLTLDDVASAFASHVAWHGHTSRKTAETLTTPRVIARALDMTLIREVPRLGGYVASSKGNAREFGEEFANWVDA